MALRLHRAPPLQLYNLQPATGRVEPSRADHSLSSPFASRFSLPHSSPGQWRVARSLLEPPKWGTAHSECQQSRHKGAQCTLTLRAPLLLIRSFKLLFCPPIFSLIKLTLRLAWHMCRSHHTDPHCSSSTSSRIGTSSIRSGQFVSRFWVSPESPSRKLRGGGTRGRPSLYAEWLVSSALLSEEKFAPRTIDTVQHRISENTDWLADVGFPLSDDIESETNKMASQASGRQTTTRAN